MAKQISFEDFCEKFKPKKTTDDCYTPPTIYEVIKNWACKEYGIDPTKIVRPFYPGGDYEEFDDGVRRVNIADIQFTDEMHKSLERMQLSYDATMKTWEDAFVVGGRVQGGHMSNGNKSV